MTCQTETRRNKAACSETVGATCLLSFCCTVGAGAHSLAVAGDVTLDPPMTANALNLTSPRKLQSSCICHVHVYCTNNHDNFSSRNASDKAYGIWNSSSSSPSHDRSGSPEKSVLCSHGLNTRLQLPIDSSFKQETWKPPNQHCPG